MKSTAKRIQETLGLKGIVKVHVLSASNDVWKFLNKNSETVTHCIKDAFMYITWVDNMSPETSSK